MASGAQMQARARRGIGGWPLPCPLEALPWLDLLTLEHPPGG